VFIGAAASAGIYAASSPTVISGKVMAANILEQAAGRGIAKVECDPEIPVGTAGAVFRCAIRGADGSTASIEYEMNREGSLSAKVLESTGPAERSPRTPGEPGADPWQR
jgi:hypothetical protein